MEGRNCDICTAEEWSVITEQGCEECTGCSRVLKEYVGEISDEIGRTIRLKESGGRAEQDVEILYQIKQQSILTRVSCILWGSPSYFC